MKCKWVKVILIKQKQELKWSNNNKYKLEVICNSKIYINKMAIKFLVE